LEVSASLYLLKTSDGLQNNFETFYSVYDI